jgi:hypothetical protein
MYSKLLQESFESSEASAPPALPADWTPAVSEMVQFPTIQVSAPVEHTEQDDQQPIVYASAVSFVPGIYKSFDELLQALKKTYDPCGELERYIRQGNKIDDLYPEQFYFLFKAVDDGFDQQRIADIMAQQMTTVTCEKVARAAAGSKDMCKREVVEKLLAAGQIMDKENAHLIKAEVTVFQYMTIERYFRD